MEMAKMKTRQLSDIDIEEISLVDLPAIRKKFVIVKNQDGKSFDKNQDDFHNKNKFEVNKMEKLIEIFKEINGLEEVSDEQMEVLKALSEEDIKKYSAALEVIKKYKGELPEDLNKELSSLAKFGVRSVAKPEKKEEDVEKAGKKLSKDTLDIIATAVKQLGGLSETVSALSNLLPTEDKQKMAEEKKKAEEVSTKIEEAVKKAKEETSKALTEKDAVIEELKKRVGTLEETKNGKKSLEEETVDEPGESKHIKKDGTFEWTFLNKQE